MSITLVKRIVFGGFALVFFAMAVYQYRSSGFSSKVAFPGISGIVLAWACATVKG